ncbi:hypothetical protein [Streptomyces luteogriseus]|uniref:Uncharacterized protein n=1 Tax=Streptomyces luteogriseus TaxID=68233 RepID=A0A7W7DL95_9ACTN|nr:hypothetical protein [Streptomyces luteogriseus]MBB4712717.1 hypothetical protein [Streptomyces luteogriseus]
MATVYQQKKMSSARREMAEGEAAASLASELIRIRRHLSNMPDKFNIVRARDRIAWTGLMAEAKRSEWNATLDEFFAPAEVAARSLRNRALRARMLDILEILSFWWALNTFEPGLMNQNSMRETVKHALECLGAWQREESIPTAVPPFTKMRELWQQVQEDQP